MINGVSTPQLDKMLEVNPQSQVIGEFLEWLRNKKKYAICFLYADRIDDEEDTLSFEPIEQPIEQLLAEYYGVDLNEAEKERTLILQSIRKDNKP